MPPQKKPNRYVCFIALREEMKYVHHRLLNLKATYRSANDFDVAFPQHRYALRSPLTRNPLLIEFYVLAEMGNLPMAAKVLLEAENNFQMAFVLGIAGTLLPSKHQLGDVVISSTAKYIGFDKIKEISDEEEFLPPTSNLIAASEKVEAPAAETKVIEEESSSPVTVLDAARPKKHVDGRKRVAAKSWARLRRDSINFPRSEGKIFDYLDDVEKIAPTLISLSLGDVGEKNASYLDQYSGAQIRTGSILGSDWVVDSSEWMEFLIERNKNFKDDWYWKHGDTEDQSRTRWIPGDVACVDMESFGFFKGLSLLPNSEIHGFAIRGISDSCAEKSRLDKDSKSRVRQIATENAASVFIDFLLWADSTGQ